MTKVKICGITNVDDALAAIDCGADYLGFVVAPSPRRVEVSELEKILKAVGDQAQTVGVFADPEDLQLFSSSTDITFDFYQLYFDHTKLNSRPPKIASIRAFWIENDTDGDLIKVDGLMLCDFKNTVNGAMHRVLSPLGDRVASRVFLAGNLQVENVKRVVRDFRPYAVDVARGTESAPGEKDRQLMLQFIQKVRDASA